MKYKNPLLFHVHNLTLHAIAHCGHVQVRVLFFSNSDNTKSQRTKNNNALKKSKRKHENIKYQNYKKPKKNYQRRTKRIGKIE